MQKDVRKFQAYGVNCFVKGKRKEGEYCVKEREKQTKQNLKI
jgi:hypothetical protein